jgi:hypothetical protein
LAGMTRRRNQVTKTKAASGGWKAANKRKQVAAKTPTAARTVIIAEEPLPPSPFWPDVVLRWWMPSVRLLR